MFFKFLNYVAGIDHELLEDCPRVDKILAVHLGVSLLLTFFIVSGIMFYSVSYIEGNSILYNVDTKIFALEQSNFGILKTLIILLISLIVGSVVFLFDRILFMSDWFFHVGFGNIEKFGWKLIQNALAKLFRIVVRLSISIAMAFALATFLELKIFESKILGRMQASHVELNQKFYDQLDDVVVARKTEISDARLRLSELTKSLIAIETQEDTTTIEKIATNNTRDKKVELFRQARIDEDNRIRAIFRETIEPLLDEKTRLSKHVGELNSTFNLATGCARVESSGSNPRNLSCDATKGAGEGRRFQEWETFAVEISSEIDSNQEKIENITDLIALEERKRDNQIVVNGTLEEEAIQSVRNEFTLILQQEELADDLRNSRRESELQTLPERIKKQKTAVDVLDSEYGPAIEISKTTIFSPTTGFTPFRDGPLDRMVALADLQADTYYGAKITEFSWWIKGFLIFLEVVPVLAKMFFSPPTGYSQLVQNKVRHHSLLANDEVKNREAILKIEKRLLEIEDERRTIRTKGGISEDIHNRKSENLESPSKSTRKK